jgi:hypothetical protein
MTSTHWQNLGLATAPKCADAKGFIHYSHTEAKMVRRAALFGLPEPVNVSEASRIVGKAQAYQEAKNGR